MSESKHVTSDSFSFQKILQRRNVTVIMFCNSKPITFLFD